MRFPKLTESIRQISTKMLAIALGVVLTFSTVLVLPAQATPAPIGFEPGFMGTHPTRTPRFQGFVGYHFPQELPSQRRPGRGFGFRRHFPQGFGFEQSRGLGFGFRRHFPQRVSFYRNW